MKFGLRWYNPYLGSWTQQDTLDSPLDPSNGNRYAYAASNDTHQRHRPQWTGILLVKCRLLHRL